MNCTTQVLLTVPVRMLCRFHFTKGFECLTLLQRQGSILEIGESMHVPSDFGLCLGVQTCICFYSSGVLVH